MKWIKQDTNVKPAINLAFWYPSRSLEQKKKKDWLISHWVKKCASLPVSSGTHLPSSTLRLQGVKMHEKNPSELLFFDFRVKKPQSYSVCPEFLLTIAVWRSFYCHCFFFLCFQNELFTFDLKTVRLEAAFCVEVLTGERRWCVLCLGWSRCWENRLTFLVEPLFWKGEDVKTQWLEVFLLNPSDDFAQELLTCFYPVSYNHHHEQR